MLEVTLHVSILVLVDFALKLEEDGQVHIGLIMFQSLFWWILLLNRNFGVEIPKISGVSILVLVDFALKHSNKSFFFRSARSFNPCFGGFCS